jgi:hypothetical protein
VKVILFKREDVGVSTISPATGKRDVLVIDDGAWPRTETEDELMARVAAKDVPADRPWVIVDRAAIPTDEAAAAIWLLAQFP